MLTLDASNRAKHDTGLRSAAGLAAMLAAITFLFPLDIIIPVGDIVK
jgi:hypothetical protein